MAGRLCKAEVRWYRATNNSLVDVRPEVELLGLNSEIIRWNKIRNVTCNAMLLVTDIPELVFVED